MKKVVIIGSKGMAGHMLYHFMKENTDYKVIDVARTLDSHIPAYKIDVTDFDALDKLFRNERPDVVINCIGILNKDAEDNPDRAVLMNSYLPHHLARKGTEMGFKLIHISTDCVFNGKLGGYTENSIKDGVGFYAQSKALGEVAYGDHLTIRTSIIGPELKLSGIGLFNWFMNQSGEIKGFTEAWWTGVTTLELAKAVVAAIGQNISGLHHLVNAHKINKYDLTSLFKTVFSRENISIIPDSHYKVDKSLIKTKEDFIYDVASYDEMILDLKNWVDNHPNLYLY